MPAAVVLPIAGPFLGLFNSLPLGVQSDDGFVLSANFQGQEINATDQYGLTLVESIWRGMNWRIRLRGLEANKTGLNSLLQMFGMVGADQTKLAPQLTNIGDRWSNYCKTLLLTAILGNPPTSPQTLTALNAGLAPGQTTEMMMTSKMKELPIEMILLPYSAASGSSSVIIPFSTT